MHRCVAHIETCLIRHFSLFLIAALMLGLLLPSLADLCAPLILPVLMLVIYFGFLKTDYTLLLKEIRNLKRQAALMLFSLILLPSLLFLIIKASTHFLGTHPAWETGVLLLFACPVAALAPTLALVMHGHFERTLCSLILTSLIAPFTIPLLLLFWVGTSIEVDVLGMCLFLTKLILIPYLLAQITLRFTPALHKTLQPHTAALSVLFLSLIVIGAVAGLSQTVIGNPKLILEGVLIATICMLLAYGIGWRLLPKNASFADRSTLAIIATWTNIGLSIVFAKQFFPNSDILLFVVLAEIPWNLAFAPAHAFIRKKYSTII